MLTTWSTLKGTTSGDLEGGLPCDPRGEENVELKRACKASEDDMLRHQAGTITRNLPRTCTSPPSSHPAVVESTCFCF